MQIFGITYVVCDKTIVQLRKTAVDTLSTLSYCTEILVRRKEEALDDELKITEAAFLQNPEYRRIFAQAGRAPLRPSDIPSQFESDVRDIPDYVKWKELAETKRRLPTLVDKAKYNLSMGLKAGINAQPPYNFLEQLQEMEEACLGCKCPKHKKHGTRVFDAGRNGSPGPSFRGRR